MMNDKQLPRVIASLALLAKTGDIPLDALGVLGSATSSEKLADHLHQRWLSDESFYRLPALILSHLHRAESDGTLASCYLMHLLSDFRSREQIRSASSLMFRNSVRVLAELFPVYRDIDTVVSECLTGPLFISLQMLADQTASEKDVQVLAEIICSHGALLALTKAKLCDDLVLMMRHHLCESDFRPFTRKMLLQVVDMWTYNWQLESAPECVLTFYGKTGLKKEIEEEVVVQPEPKIEDQESIV